MDRQGPLMTRTYSLIAAALLTLAIAASWQSSRAGDDEKPASADRVAELSSSLELIERIESLEKRIAALEGRDNLIREASGREPRIIFSQVKPIAAPVKEPAQQIEEDDEDPQTTNGHKWKIRFLGHRKPVQGKVL